MYGANALYASCTPQCSLLQKYDVLSWFCDTSVVITAPFIAPEYIIRADAKRSDDYKIPLVNPIFLPENIEYVRALQRRLNYTPSSVNVQTHSLKANGSQEQLSDIDRKQ